MADKPMNNFKTAVNELMSGKIRTDEEDLSSLSETPVFRMNDPAPFIPAVPATGSEQASVLASDIIIEGSVKSKSDIRLSGYIKGDVSCGGTVVSTGTVDGSIDSANITLIGSTVNGNINVRGSLSIDSTSSITGDIIGTSLISDGKIKGNIILKESIVLQANATVVGNVKAKNISIESGTTLIGNIEIKASGTGPSFIPEPADSAVDDAVFAEPLAALLSEEPDEEPITVFSPKIDKEATKEAE